MTLPHEKLVAWQRADDLFIAIYRLTSTYPAYERFGMTAQIRRAAYSVPANIVEGLARRSKPDRLRLLNVSEASLAEVAYCLHASRRLGYIANEVYEEYRQRTLQVGAPLAGLVRSITRQHDAEQITRLRQPRKGIRSAISTSEET